MKNRNWLSPGPQNLKRYRKRPPFYLNPEVLAREEQTQAPEPLDEKEPSDENILADQPPEKIETVLNSGMQFIAGLMEMATGKKVETSDSQEKMITIDRNTGEVTMKFKLPGILIFDTHSQLIGNTAAFKVHDAFF